MKNMLKKKEKSKIFLKSNNIFECPICNSELSLNENMLNCINNHTFDIKSNGSLFLVSTSNYKESKHYNKSFFLARRKFINNEYYKRVYKFIINYINQNYENELLILDLGCGEFTHTNKICENLDGDIKVLGVDYSKSAIDLATDYLDGNNVFVVGDITNLPLKNESVDIIINFLSPFNEKEVNRILKKDGTFIKIIPTKMYLRELREIYNMSEYNNETEVLVNIKEKFKVELEKEIVDSFKIKNKEDLKYLLTMTPLTWNEINQKNKEIKEITIALKVLILKKR